MTNQLRLHTAYMHESGATFIRINPTDKLCPPCRLSLHSHRGHPESPDGADYIVLHNTQHSVGETEKMSINIFY